MLSEEELRRLIESLSIREIIEPAFDNWKANESTGKTVIDLKTGRVYGISHQANDLFELNHDSDYIELYKLEFHEDLFDEEELLKEEEYDRFMLFKEKKEEDDEYYDDYDPKHFSEFCIKESIDERERKIKFLMENYEEYHFNNYQDFEHSIILTYYDEDDYTY